MRVSRVFGSQVLGRWSLNGTVLSQTELSFSSKWTVTDESGPFEPISTVMRVKVEGPGSPKCPVFIPSTILNRRVHVIQTVETVLLKFTTRPFILRSFDRPRWYLYGPSTLDLMSFGKTFLSCCTWDIDNDSVSDNIWMMWVYKDTLQNPNTFW